MPGFHRFNITNQRLILDEIGKRERVKDPYSRSILSRIIILGLQGSLIVDIHYIFGDDTGLFVMIPLYAGAFFVLMT